MGFNLPAEYLERQKEIQESKYVEYDGKRTHVSEFADKSITPIMQGQMSMNGYAAQDMPPKLDNAALVETAERYLVNCSKTYTCSTYEESLLHTILPELLKRFKEERN